MDDNLSLGATKDGKTRQSASSVSETQHMSFPSAPANGQADIFQNLKGSQEDKTCRVQTGNVS